eukprot:SAG31_NODE_7608_length_1642_cov_2.813999_2_plen_147_part_00
MLDVRRFLLGDDPYEYDSDTTGSASDSGTTSSTSSLNSGAIITIVVASEVIVIGGLLLLLWSRKRKTESATQEALLQGADTKVAADRSGQPTYRWVIFVTIGMFAGYASLVSVRERRICIYEYARVLYGLIFLLWLASFRFYCSIT